MKRIKLILIICICFPFLGSAQHGGTTFTSSIGVKSLRIGTKYTSVQIETIFGGSPTTYCSSISEFGLDEGYQYENSWFSFAENGMFVGFNITSDNFAVFEQYNGGVRVGNLISKVTQLGAGGTLVAKPDGKYEWWLGDEVMYFRVENDIIVRIYYNASV